ncbi:UNVERIFIED_CONTAM: hypothetical protein Scaly_2917900 [Sesamum calycinum]|uniref:Pectinesterase inhibitor domain-containing protein n=1 Tax=Sesamum calycinum TaxID=2727403 RepID=A0AAW2L148_9LAMI
MANTVDQLNQSVQELSRADQDFDWHVGNVESWVGTALTFENTCLDGFRNPMMDGNVKVAIRRGSLIAHRSRAMRLCWLIALLQGIKLEEMNKV